MRCALPGRIYEAGHMENAGKCMKVAGGVWTLVPTSRIYFNFKITSVLSLCSNSFFLVVLVSLTCGEGVRNGTWHPFRLSGSLKPVIREQAVIIPHWM